MANEKFCLKWNDFEQNISGAFRELKDDADFFDVTLACDSDREVSAHKVILSACSPFFRQVLRRQKHQHPLLYLRGVSFSDLESVLAFMYNGEVNIAQEQLNSFLAVAEDLKVKGLTQGGKDGSQADTERSKSPQHSTTTSSKPSSQRNSTVMSQPPQKRARPEPTNYEEDDEIEEVVPVKTEIGATAMGETQLDVAGYEEEGYEEYGGYEQQYEDAGGSLVHTQTGMAITKDLAVPDDLYQFILKTEDGYQCSICNKFFNKKGDAKNHCEAIHFREIFEYTCEFCSSKFSSNSSYRKHKSRKHRDLLK